MSKTVKNEMNDNYFVLSMARTVATNVAIPYTSSSPFASSKPPSDELPRLKSTSFLIREMKKIVVLSPILYDS